MDHTRVPFLFLIPSPWFPTVAAPVYIPNKSAQVPSSPRPAPRLSSPVLLLRALRTGQITSPWGLTPGCRSTRGRFHSMAAATASTRCSPERTEGARGSGSPCAPPPPGPPRPPPHGTGAQSWGTEAMPPRGLWRGRRAEGGHGGSPPPQSRGTRFARSRPPLPGGGTVV